MKNAKNKNYQNISLHSCKLTAFKWRTDKRVLHSFRCYLVIQLQKNRKLTSSLNVFNTLFNKQRYGPIRSDQVLKRHPKIVALPISTSWWVQWLCGLYCLCLLRKDNTLDSMITTMHTDDNHVSIFLIRIIEMI